MHVKAVLVRTWDASTGHAQSGQIMVLFAVMLTSLIGMAALAVDVGHAFERRQFVQGVANDAARAGAFAVYGNRIATRPTPPAVPSASAEDTSVAVRIVDTLMQSGLLSPKNYTYNSITKVATISAPPQSACGASLQGNQDFMQAVYLDTSSPPQQILINGAPAAVGTASGQQAWTNSDKTSGDVPGTTIGGVQVTKLEMCIPHFFAGVVHFGRFDVGSDASFALAAAATVHTTNLPTPGDAPFYVFAQKCQTGCSPNPYSMYAVGSTLAKYPGPSATNSTNAAIGATCPDDFNNPVPCSGDLVTLHDHSNGQGNWDAWQFTNPTDGLNNTPSPALPLGSGSNRGCLDPFATNLTFGVWSFNGPGNGANCAASPVDGSTVIVPLVNEVCKNTTPTNPPVCSDEEQPPCTNGGFCVQIVGFVEVYVVRDLTDGKLVQGYITHVLDDPYCTVEASPTQDNTSPSNPTAPPGHPGHQADDVIPSGSKLPPIPASCP